MRGSGPVLIKCEFRVRDGLCGALAPYSAHEVSCGKRHHRLTQRPWAARLRPRSGALKAVGDINRAQQADRLDWSKVFRFDDEYVHGMYVEDMLSDIRHLREYLAPERELTEKRRDQLDKSGRFVVEQLHELSSKLAEAEARAATFIGGDHRGDHLVLGEYAGGRRHFLAGRPVRAGAGLCLLTRYGWMQGRYEWSYDERPPRFYHTLPHGEQVEMELPYGARLAWPADLGLDPA